MNKQRSILFALVAILGVLVQVSEATYTPLTATQIAASNVQAMLSYSANGIVQLAYNKSKIPVSTYSISTVSGVSMETETTGNMYACNVTIGGVNGVVVKANFTSFVRSSNQAITLQTYSYSASNLPKTNTTTTNTTTNTTGNTGTTNTTGNTGTTNTTTGNVGSSTSPVPETLIANMSARYTRYHHYLWHQVRENWNQFTATQQSTFTNLGWKPPRPALGFYANGSSYVLTDNGSGEDFLYMHRHMIAWAKANSVGNTVAVSAWATVPAPGDKSYPVPANYTVPNNPSMTSSTTNQKTDSYYTRNILPWEKTFTDPSELKKMTLGQLGARIHYSIHNALHMRFSEASSYGYRNGYSGIVPNINTQWDNPSYNWMGDLYASQVHPYFWRIHGWVDARISDWMAANNVKTLVWNNTWIGGPMSSLSSVGVKMPSRLLRGEARTLGENDSMGGMEDMDMSGGDHDILDKAMEALIATGIHSGLDSPQPYMEDFVPEKHKYHGSQ